MTDANVVLVEGPEDWNVLFHLIKHYYPAEQLSVTRKGDYRPRLEDASAEVRHILFDVVQGNSLFKPKSLSGLLKRSDLQRVGIIVDADLDLQLCWRKLCGSLASFGYINLPASPNATGTIVQQADYPTVGIWVMPDNLSAGALEDFVGLMKPPGDTLWTQAEEAVAHIPEKDRLFKPQAFKKAQIHTWLAWQEEPGTPMGQAVTKRYLNAESPSGRLLIDWLRRLFELND